ncbi:organic hydroperoxide resistance protein [Pelagibius marinus]|uniref:organic hydroperoxide resistance protein n=1 Tax=Pelagibius marinus TaxID=2762760 RepID=UPI00187289E2|nr:organic hydroperoxide resistance protein [Pelagibius marinus]
MKVLYTTEASATGGRTGSAATSDGAFSVALTTPKELGGPGGEGNNPEQLFAAGYSACFLGAVKFVGAQKKVKIAEDSKVTATVGIGPRDDGEGFGLDVALAVSLPGLERDVAQAVVDQAHIVCPYSHATRNGLDVRVTLV